MPVPALAGDQPLVQLHRPGLLEQVDDRLAVGAERDGRSGVQQPAGGADAVGEVALGGGAHAHVGGGAAEQRHVHVGQVGGVHRRRAWSERAVLVQHLHGRGRVELDARLVLRRLLGDVRVQRRGVPVGEVDDHGHLLGRHRAHGVDGRADLDVLLALVHLGEVVGPGGPSIGVPVAEAQLGAGEGVADAAGQIAGVEQGDAQPGPPGRLDQRVAHRVRVGVRPPPGPWCR